MIGAELVPHPAPPSRPAGDPDSGHPVWVIASGKGGVGKSTLAVLLGAEWAARGVLTLMFDGVQNEGSLNVLLDRSPARAVSDVLCGATDPRELLIEISERLWLLPAPADDRLSATLSPLDRARLHHRMTAAFDRFGAVLVDAGPGRAGSLRAVTLRASGLAVVATPEPASLREAYAMLKLARQQAPHLREGLIVNRAECAEEATEVHARLELATRRFLGRDLPLLGVLPESPAIRRATRTPGGLLEIAEPELRRAVGELAASLGAPAGSRVEGAA